LRPVLPAWAGRAAVTAAFLAGAVLLFLGDPRHSAYFPPCPFHWLTGLYCPGCGSLRAAHCLLHGHLADAFRLNALFVLSLPLLVVLRLRRDWAYQPWVAWAAFCMLVGYGVLRNVPGWPLAMLGPH
jgi:hypothetical protein